MSALPCSSSLPWLAKGLTPFGEVLWVSTFFSTPASRSAHWISRPSLANRPSSKATSSGKPWNGAVVSRTSFFIGCSIAVRANALVVILPAAAVRGQAQNARLHDYPTVVLLNNGL